MNISAQTDSSKYYFNKAFKSSDYKYQIVNYTKYLGINPNDVNAFDKRGAAKWYLKLEYCSDFKKACDLGKCNNYNKFCK